MRDDVHRRMRCLVAGVVAFVVTVAWSGGFAQSAFVPFQPNLYPHRVEYFVNDQPLLCPTVPNATNATMGWANRLGGGQVPRGAAGAVLYQQPGAAIMLSWEHPIYDPTSRTYRFQFTAVSNASPTRGTPPARIGGIRRNIKDRPLTGPDGSTGAGVNGRTLQAGGLLQIRTRESSFTAFPPGPAIEIWATGGSGASGCRNWLATYYIWAQ